MNTLPEDLIEVGTVIEAYGIKGALKVRPFSDDPVGLLAAKEIWLQSPKISSGLKEYSVYKSRMHSGSVLLDLVGLTDRDIALSYKSAVVLVSRASFPTLEEDEFYWTDLIGLPVENLQHETLGHIKELLSNGPQTVMVIEQGDAQYLIPFVEVYVHEVQIFDKSTAKIVVDWQKDW